MKKSSLLVPVSSFLRSRAFTIIELLVVIAIIALLTGIIMTSLVGSKAKARDAKRVSDLGNIQLALELYYDRCKQYPSTQSQLNIADNNGCPSGSGITLGTFLSTVPKNPLPNPENNPDYEYVSFPNPTFEAYVLRVALESAGDVIGNACSDTAIGGAPANQYCLISN